MSALPHGADGADGPVEAERQLDRAERLAVALQRQRGRCLWCRRPFGTMVPPSTDQAAPAT